MLVALVAAVPSAAFAGGPQSSGTGGDDPAATSTALTLRALAVDGPILLDGVLEEPAWQQADVATGFVQREPEEGRPATERTEVRVVYTDDRLYIGILALDSDPSRIIADQMQRDGSGGGGGARFRGGALDSDDSIIVVLDTFLDRRNAFFFETNPNGARADALITDEGRDRNFEWDGVWEVAAGPTAEGWVAEISIPFATLRFDPQLDTWGINVRRMIRRKNEEVYWAPIERDADIFRVSRAGQLTGIRASRPGLNLRVKPFVVASGSEGFDTPVGTLDGDAEGGLDVRWGLTQSLTLDLTFNTDFAQVEVDEQRVNLTRFSLFFPEKREFFLENAGIFEFGPGGAGGGGFRAPLLKVFFSRRIGIGPEGALVPIAAGGRLTGRVGEWNIGLLDVQTQSVTALDSGLDEAIPANNWGVLRIKRNVGERSSIGAIVTNRHDGATFNRVYGLDADLNPHERLGINGFWTASDDQGADSDNWAAGGGIDWRGPVWRWGFDFTEIRDDYNPEVGFLLRRGIRRYNQNVNFDPRPDIPGVRNLMFNARAEVVTSSDGTLETVDSSVRLFGVRFDTEDSINFSVNPNFERLFEPFEIQPGIFVPEGEYTYHDWSIFLNTNSSRTFSANGFFVWGDFFDGERTTWNLTFNARPSGTFSSSTEWNRNDVSLPSGDFATNTYRQRLDVSFSPELFTNTFLQYSDAADLLSLNLRLDWIYRPGADLFVVYNQSWDTPASGSIATRDRALIVKFTYLLSL